MPVRSQKVEKAIDRIDAAMKDLMAVINKRFGYGEGMDGENSTPMFTFLVHDRGTFRHEFRRMGRVSVKVDAAEMHEWIRDNLDTDLSALAIGQRHGVEFAYDDSMRVLRIYPMEGGVAPIWRRIAYQAWTSVCMGRRR